MKKQFICLLLAFFLWFGLALPSFTMPEIQEVKASLGNSAGELKFIPNHFDFVVGQK